MSVNTPVKVIGPKPLEPFGVTDNWVKNAGAGVHHPSVIQPGDAPVKGTTSPRRFMGPVKPDRKVTLTGTVRFGPDVMTGPPVPDSVHWLFDTEDTVPGVIGPRVAVFPSLNRNNAFEPGRYKNKQLFLAPPPVDETWPYATIMSAAPAESVYVKANV